MPQLFLLSIGISPLPTCTLNKSAFESLMTAAGWCNWLLIVFLSLCTIARLSASCIASLCVVTCFFVHVVHFSLVTTLFSLLFYFIRYIIGHFFVVVLSVYGCIYFSVILIFVRLSASCHIATCFFVDVVDFSLVTTLFVLFH